MNEEPTDVSIVLIDGDQIPCLVEKVGPLHWQAIPVIDVELEDVQHMNIDVLPAGGTINLYLSGGEEE